MPDLSFAVTGAGIWRDAATPTLSLDLAIRNQPAEQPIHAIVLRCQIQIETPRRRYTPNEQQELRDLFGEPERWGSTLRPMLWMNTSITVPAFTGSTVAPVPIPCTFDLQAASAKYFHALEGGEVPLTLLFSGSIFYDPGDGRLQAAPISWNAEARYRLPVQLWQELQDLYYGNTAWLSLRRDVFEELYRYKVREGLPTFEAALERMLAMMAETRVLS